jgi:hypothetical protein
MKYKTARVKINGIWSVIYLERVHTDLWNLGIIISKSRRAANDWYSGRKNKRSRRIAAQQSVGSFRHLLAAFTRLKKLLLEIPRGHSVYTYPESKRSAVLSRYIQRLGFTEVLQGGLQLWILTAARKKEVLFDCEHTN